MAFTSRKHLAVAAGVALLLSACGGGGGGSTTTTASHLSGTNPGAVSSGAITAFGSVFVNGHEFRTDHAQVIDDDTGAVSTGTTGLEVGMVVDVKAADDSTDSAPDAAELHVHALARGYVDASSSTGATLTVMGQSAQVTSATVFSDHRACVTATTNACTAITGQSGLAATTGSGSTAVPGSYVSVFGYLFGDSSSAHIVATLVSVADAPATGASGPVFKAEGPVATLSATGLTIGGLTVDLSQAACRTGESTVACASAFSTGQVVSVYTHTQPALPATAMTADAAILRDGTGVQTAGATVEVEGQVSAVTTNPAGFTVRGMAIDASALPAGTALPAVGDIVEVTGTVSSSGQSITASALQIDHVAGSATYGLEGDVTAVAAGTGSNSFVVTVLGEALTVDAQTWLGDHSLANWDEHDPASNPFNITTFQAYLAASASQHVVVRASNDATGHLHADSFVLMPASTRSGMAGTVDATPAPANSTVAGTPTTFDVHGLAISAAPASILGPQNGDMGGNGNLTAVTVAANDHVLVFGTFANGVLSVSAPPSRSQVVVDFGLTRGEDDGGF